MAPRTITAADSATTATATILLAHAISALAPLFRVNDTHCASSNLTVVHLRFRDGCVFVLEELNEGEGLWPPRPMSHRDIHVLDPAVALKGATQIVHCASVSDVPD